METVQNPTAPREPWRLEERRILAANAYRIEFWATFARRDEAVWAFCATLRKSAPGFYGPHAEHRLVVVEEGAR